MRAIHSLLVLATLLLISLTSCNEITCENTLCENGGICIDGTCDCPDGFIGTCCRERTTPDKMRITSVAITRFPGLKDGGTWDDLDGPDIFFKLYDNIIPIAKPISLFENADATQSYSFSIYSIETSNITGKHIMQLLDYDGFNITPDFMGEIEFVPYESMNGLPETIVLDDGGPVAFTMTVDYLYDEKTR